MICVSFCNDCFFLFCQGAIFFCYAAPIFTNIFRSVQFRFVGGGFSWFPLYYRPFIISCARVGFAVFCRHVGLCSTIGIVMCTLLFIFRFFNQLTGLQPARSGRNKRLHDSVRDVPAPASATGTGAEVGNRAIRNGRVLRPAQASKRIAVLAGAKWHHHGHAFTRIRVGENARIQTPGSRSCAHLCFFSTIGLGMLYI